MQERFKSSKEVKDKEEPESPSGISKFFTALFMCGVQKDEKKDKEKTKIDEAEEKEDKYEI